MASGNMPASEDETNSLRLAIERAFRENRYPGDKNLVYDTSGYHLECDEIAAAFRGRPWQGLSVHVLKANYSALYFFTPRAYGFYLPAFLIASIVSPEGADIIPEAVCHSLTPPGDGASQEEVRSFAGRMEEFTDEQRQAISASLRYLVEKYADELAPWRLLRHLLHYWQVDVPHEGLEEG